MSTAFVSGCRSPKRPIAGFVLLLFFAILITSAAASASESHRYLQQSGDSSYYFDWVLDHSDGYLLRAVSDAEEHRTEMDETLGTQRWTLTNPAEKTRVQAVREGNRILLSGHFQGKRLDRELAIDDAPWFQSLSTSLRAFLATPQPTTEFWTLRPDKLSLHKIRASKKGSEILDIGRNTVEAHRVEVRLTGLASLFGSGCYWFRTSDNLLVRYQGPRGLPGIPTTTITLVPPL